MSTNCQTTLPAVTRVPEPEQDYLRSIGLVAAPVAGALTLTIGEDTQGSVTGPTLAWELGNVQVASQPGYTWKITGASGSTNPLFRPIFDPGSSDANLTVTLENGRAHFSRFPNGGRKPSADQFIACRTDFTLVMTKSVGLRAPVRHVRPSQHSHRAGGVGRRRVDARLGDG